MIKRFMNRANLVFICALIVYGTIFLPACNTQKRMQTLVYFNQQGDSTLAKTIQNYEPTIQAGDRLNIVVNALDPASAAPYNLGSGSITTSTGSGGSSAPATGGGNGGYIVEADGTIHFPQLG